MDNKGSKRSYATNSSGYGAAAPPQTGAKEYSGTIPSSYGANPKTVIEVVTEGAIIDCKFGTEFATLKSSGNKNFKSAGRVQLTISDTKLKEKDFKICKKLSDKAEKKWKDKGKKGKPPNPVKCKPDLEDKWTGFDKATKVDSEPGLTIMCHLKCQEAGDKNAISIIASGQDAALIKGGKEVWEFLLGDDIYKAWTGRDPDSYRKLAWWDRALSIASLIPWGKAVKGGKLALKYGDDLVRGGSKVALKYGDDVLKYGDDAARAGSKAKKAISKTDDVSQIRKNAKQGQLFEQQEFPKFAEKTDNAVEQITIKTNKENVKIRVDAIGVDKNTGKVVINEFKSSNTAPLTPNQKIGFPDLELNGGQVVGKGKGAFTGGVEIPPVTVEIIRPPK
ncbi:hypothetical protein RyT2_18310 [Pseudolactococcus yaeyamensis]